LVHRLANWMSGTPEDVYNHPASPFVARFTGLAGELRVRVAAHGSDGTLEITAADGAAGTFPALRPVSSAVSAPGVIRAALTPRGTRPCWPSARPGYGCHLFPADGGTAAAVDPELARA
jgi:hypothetical protein